MGLNSLQEQMELAKTHCPALLEYARRLERALGGHSRRNPEQAEVVIEARRGGPPEWLSEARRQIAHEVFTELAEAFRDWLETI